MPDRIPERNPVGDSFKGVLLQHGESFVLAVTALNGATVVHDGELIVHYGLQFLGKPHLSVVPGILALDYGEMLTGEAAWDFLLKRSNLYPRADVVGYRNDGEDEMIPVKRLDMVAPKQVLVYADADDRKPLAQVEALITAAGSATSDQYPARLLEYLPQYTSLSAWDEARANDE